MLIVFDIITDMEANKKISSSLTELLLRDRKLNISLAFISQSYFKALKTIRLNTKHTFIMKITNKRKLQQIALNYLSNIKIKISWSFKKIMLK